MERENGGEKPLIVQKKKIKPAYMYAIAHAHMHMNMYWTRSKESRKAKGNMPP